MRRSKGTLFRPTVTRTVNGKRSKRKSAFYWARYTDGSGQPQRHALTLPGGVRVTDKDVARCELDKILQRAEREAAGMVDRTLEAALVPFRRLLADYARHLRRKRVSRDHLAQTIQVGKWFADHAEITRLADVTEERIDRALGKLADSGRSARTCNLYRSLMHGLCRYAIRHAKLMTANPVEAVGIRSWRADTRKLRRALTVEEAARLLNVAGPRRDFFAVQLWTGPRVSEVAALEWRDVELEGNRPAIRLRAEATKAKRADIVPLHPGLCDVLAAARKAVPFAQPTDRVFAATPILRTFKLDLDRAAITWRKADHDDGASIDRHALRTTFVSWLEAAGVTGTAKRVLARHAAVGVTERNYTDARLLDLWAEIRKLPAIPQATQAASLKATGTDPTPTGRVLNSPRQPTSTRVRARGNPVALPVALLTGRQGVNAALGGMTGGSVTEVLRRENTGKTSVFSPENVLGCKDSNLELPDPESGVLPIELQPTAARVFTRLGGGIQVGGGGTVRSSSRSSFPVPAAIRFAIPTWARSSLVAERRTTPNSAAASQALSVWAALMARWAMSRRKCMPSKWIRSAA